MRELCIAMQLHFSDVVVEIGFTLITKEMLDDGGF